MDRGGDDSPHWGRFHFFILLPQEPKSENRILNRNASLLEPFHSDPI